MARPASKPTRKPVINPSTSESLLYGNAVSNLTRSHQFCSEGHKVVNIKIAAVYWINLLTASCDDQNKTILGPWGKLETLADIANYREYLCSDGFTGWNITYGTLIGQMDFACSRGSFIQPIGIALGIGPTINNQTVLDGNQAVIGFHVFHDSLGIHALKMEYAPMPPSKIISSDKSLSKSDQMAILWGFLTMAGVITLCVSLFVYFQRKRQKQEFRLIDQILPMK